jgi:hypothetical protein
VEAAGQSGVCAINSRWPLRSVIETDLAGDVMGVVPHSNAGLSFAIKPFEIKTFRMEMS